jgi:hypothetical protein
LSLKRKYRGLKSCRPTDVDVIKALFSYDAKGGRPTGLRRFIDDTFPGIPEKQLIRCMDVAFTRPLSGPTIDTEAAELADEALSKAGCDDLAEFLREGSDEANELLEKLKKLGERDSPKKHFH